MVVPLRAVQIVLIALSGHPILSQGGMDNVDRAVAELYRRLEESAEE